MPADASVEQKVEQRVVLKGMKVVEMKVDWRVAVMAG